MGFGCISIAVWCSSKQQCLLVCKKSDYNSDSFKTHDCTRGAALGAGWLNCLSCGTKYSPTPPALESGKTRVHEVGQGGVQQWDQASIPATFRQSAGLQKCRGALGTDMPGILCIHSPADRANTGHIGRAKKPTSWAYHASKHHSLLQKDLSATVT